MAAPRARAGGAQVIPISRPRRQARSSSGLTATLPDGARVTTEEGGLTLRDPAGRLLLRYRDGSAEIAAPDGDLTLAAPLGKVKIASATDVEIAAARDVTLSGGRALSLGAGRAEAPAVAVTPAGVEVKAPKVSVEAPESRLVTGEGSVVARTIVTTAGRIAHHAERYEVTASRLVERTRDTFRDVADLCQSRIGRARTVVRDAFALWSGRTSMVSKEDTSIDGSRVLLG